MGALVDLGDVSDEEWPGFYVAVLRENGRRETLRTARERAEQAARDYEAAVAGAPAVEATGGAVVGPGGRTVVDGVVWVNTSGAWLSPVAAGPGAYPVWWRLEDPPVVEDNLPWTPGAPVVAGDLRTYGGSVWRCVQGHTPQTGWEPPGVPALWALA